MRIHVYSIMRNEIQILPFFLRHYETLADKIFVWDDQSTDGTRELLQAHPKVTLLPLELNGIDDDYWVESLWPQYKSLSRGQADWVIQVDADEFVYHPDYRRVFRKLKQQKYDIVKPAGYLMVADSFPSGYTGQIYDKIKKGLRDKFSEKQCIFNPNIDIKFKRGRHHPDTITHPSGREINLNFYESGIKILHFRFFGLDKFFARIERNYERVKIGLAGTPREYVTERFNADGKKRLPDNTIGTYRQWFEKNLPLVTDVI